MNAEVKQNTEAEGIALQSFALPLLLQEAKAIKLETEQKKEPEEAFELTFKTVVSDSTLAWVTKALKGHKVVVSVQFGSEGAEM